MNVLRRYCHWLHLGFPAGRVERLPVVREDGSTAVPGLYVAGDLAGPPLLKFAADSGARAVRAIAAEPRFLRRAAADDVRDIAVVGGGVAGMAAALEAKRLGLSVAVVESAAPFATIANFPRRKPIFTYPPDFEPAGAIRFGARSAVKEGLLEELLEQIAGADLDVRQGRAVRVAARGGHLAVELAGGGALEAHRVLVAIGRSGDHRRLGVPGEERDKVSNRLHDPADFAGRDVLVVGGGDSALEAARALADAGARVTVSYRGGEFARPKPENVAAVAERARAGRLRVAFSSEVTEIGAEAVTLATPAGPERIPNDAVLPLIGREAPLDFFRRSGVPIRGEWTLGRALGLLLFLAFCTWLYNWKAGGALNAAWQARGWFPYRLSDAAFGALRQPGFWYSLAYCVLVVAFGVRRIRRRRTPYVRVQTLALMAVQVVPLFLLPYFVLPAAGAAGWFDSGFGRGAADALFPADAAGAREYWRAFGLVLAWPLFLWNVFTNEPLWVWLAISVVQTCVLIPLLIWRFGKGAYCGWICSCGALAETLGDAHREKMPHGPAWNRLNLVGQVLLALCLVLALLRVAGWIWPGSAAERICLGLLSGWTPLGIQANYYWAVDVLLAGILGVGLYFHFSGRTWCRFACPLAALMHIYARFSRFRILADKKKCISCNVCTSVCHQGIDVMSFANKGLALDDPQCVRCSACVQSCPTGVLAFGTVDPATGRETGRDRLAAALEKGR